MGADLLGHSHACSLSRAASCLLCAQVDAMRQELGEAQRSMQVRYLVAPCLSHMQRVCQHRPAGEISTASCKGTHRRGLLSWSLEDRHRY